MLLCWRHAVATLGWRAKEGHGEVLSEPVRERASSLFRGLRAYVASHGVL